MISHYKNIEMFLYLRCSDSFLKGVEDRVHAQVLQYLFIFRRFYYRMCKPRVSCDNMTSRATLLFNSDVL